MPNTREKLIELFRGAINTLEERKENWILGGKVGERPGIFDCYADHLIANGVTVQEWISVKERLPENDQWVLCFMKDKAFGTFRVFQWNYIDWQWNDGNEWYDEKDVTHWMPLPPAPEDLK